VVDLAIGNRHASITLRGLSGFGAAGRVNGKARSGVETEPSCGGLGSHAAYTPKASKNLLIPWAAEGGHTPGLPSPAASR